MPRRSALLLGLTVVLLGVAGVRGDETDTPLPNKSIAEMLDDFHAAAAAADETRYFGHFAPDAVFLGTDPHERWTIPEFRAYAQPHFDAGQGWAYRAVARHVDVAPGGMVGWFDETVRNAKYGDLRGSGVVLLVDGAWKIAQYNLTFTVPNDLALEVVERIAEHP